MKCKKHGDVGGIGFSVFPESATPIEKDGYSHLYGSLLINGPGYDKTPDEMIKSCSYYNIFCVQCVGELFEKLGVESLLQNEDRHVQQTTAPGHHAA